MKAILMTVLFAATLLPAANAEEWILLENFDNHSWMTSYGGNPATITASDIDGRKGLQVAITGGEPGYALVNTGRFHSEDWSDADRVEMDIYYAEESGHNSKLELKNSRGETIDTIYCDLLTPDTWHHVNFNFTEGKDYSDVAQVILSVEKVGTDSLDVYFRDLSLLKDGELVGWDDMESNGVDWFYGGDRAPAIETVEEPRATGEAKSEPGALYLAWKDVPDNGVNFQEATRRFDPPRDISEWKQIRFRVRSDDRKVSFKPFFWDGDSGYTCASRSVERTGEWETLTFDLAYVDEPGFDAKHATEFKIVVEGIDYGDGGDAGEALADDVEFHEKASAPAKTSPYRGSASKR
jgi:hypothetical protein